MKKLFFLSVLLLMPGCAMLQPTASQLQEDKLLLTNCRSVIDGSKKLDDLNRRAMVNEINTNIMAINKALAGEKLPEVKPITVDYVIYLISQFEETKREADDNYTRLAEAVQISTSKKGR